ncbi:hypothetical protein JKG47_01065 [Acidithiobacillus sp. MC6.1]|nr:hypothetical protein [Acidithiobacillus sp. MC6.1]
MQPIADTSRQGASLAGGATHCMGATLSPSAGLPGATPYVYVLIRTDIPVAYQVTQACHAALEVGFDHSRPQGPPVHLVTLAVENGDALQAAQDRLDCAGIGHHLFYEPDEHDGAVMGHTALASAPVSGTHRKLFSRYPLWRSSHSETRDRLQDR